MLSHGHIGPVVPGRDAQLLAQLIDTIDGAATVTTSDNELITNGGDDIFFTFAFQVGKFQFVDILVLADGTNQNRRIASSLREAGTLS